MHNKKIIVISLIITFVGSFSYGVLVGHYKIFPYDTLDDINFFVTNKVPANQEPRRQIYQDVSKVGDLIRISNEDDVVKKRNQLIAYIWLNEGFPSQKLPQTIETDINDSDFADLKNLKRIDSLTIEMEKYGMNSISYLFLPVSDNNKLVIYHQGHDGQSFKQDKDKIQFFLEKGYAVLIFAMVGHGLNNEPIIEFEEFGKLRLNSHNHFKFIESNSFHPIKYFFEPITIALNYLDTNYDYDSYYMVGLSGGGWTTVVYSAIDPRISKSFSVAGSFPIWLRSAPSDFGDYEQTIPDFYKIANYEELYVLSSYGENRELVQIFNKFDSCCFTGKLYEEFPYENAIKTKLQELGKGDFKVIIDDTHDEHKISNYALSKIIANMEEN